MKVQYHCLNCNRVGDKEINITDLVMNRKNNEDLMTLILDAIKPDCCKNPDIGVRAKE